MNVLYSIYSSMLSVLFIYLCSLCYFPSMFFVLFIHLFHFCYLSMFFCAIYFFIIFMLFINLYSLLFFCFLYVLHLSMFFMLFTHFLLFVIRLLLLWVCVMKIEIDKFSFFLSFLFLIRISLLASLAPHMRICLRERKKRKRSNPSSLPNPLNFSRII